MKWGLRELIYRAIKYFVEGLIKPKKEINNGLCYRGVFYNENDIKIRKQGNNNMSYRGVAYQLLNSEIKVKK